MARHEARPSLSQAVRMKKLFQSGELTIAVTDAVFSGEKKPPKEDRDRMISRIGQRI